MSECKACGSDEYSTKNGCDECGHYNEDRRHRRSKRNKRNDRWVQNHS